MALAERGLESGDPIKPKDPLGPAQSAESPADD
jgi:agmatinase